MKNLGWSCIVAALIAGIPLSASAVDEGLYVGLGGGVTRGTFKTEDFTANSPVIAESKDESDKGYKVFLGYRLAKYFAAEAGYTDLGKFNYDYASGNQNATLEYKVRGWTFTGLGILPFSEQFSIFGRAGVFRAETRTSQTSSSGAFSTTLTAAGAPSASENTKQTTILGVGAQIDFSRQIAMRIEYETYGNVGDQSTTGRMKPTMTSASLLFKF